MKSFVFSYNRACQLDLMIRSHQKFWGDKLVVSYDYSTDEFKQGYAKLMKKHPEVKWLDRMNGLKHDLLCEMDEEFISIWNDDDVMIRKFPKSVPLYSDVVTISPRLDPKYTDYVDDKNVMPPPKFDMDWFWFWMGQPLDWGCPFAILGGNIFRTSVLKPMVEKAVFDTPSSLEPQLQYMSTDIPLMQCFKKALSINCPVNKVQTEAPSSKFGNIHQDLLNAEWLNGRQINLDSIIKQTKDATSCFMMVDFEMEDQC